ncbi:hypothetical protein [Actinopolymorpha cephalotaxi]|uniref:hypothetical protein n=1 Tax=Actinopolymorpha cephalotaxi TaxID=504797 RepID=UPI0036265A7F
MTGVLPKLVGDALTRIYRDDKPTAVLDVLPARGKEARNHADDILNEPVMRAVSEKQCIPSLGGGLRHPTRVQLHPEGLTVEELELWASVCPDPEAWTSHTVVSAEHRSKVVRLLGYHKRDAVRLRQWVEHLVKEPTVEGSAAAVRLVALLIDRLDDRDQVEQLKKARVLLLEDGSVDACRRGQVFLPGPTPQPGRLIINPVVASDGRVVSALNALGIEIFDNAGELRSELTDDQVRWERVWASARKNAIEQSEAIFRDVFGDRLLEKLRVRTYSGKWKGPGGVFLAGEVIPADGSRDGDFLVDPRFHQQDIRLLQRLGLVSAPRRLASPPMEAWREARLDAVRDRYRKQTGQPRLADSAIDIDEGRTVWPLDVLPRLSDAARTALTESVMRQLLGDERWRITRIGGAAQQMYVTDMTWYHLRDHGRLRTQIGIQPVSRCLRWNEDGVKIDGLEQPLPYVQPMVSEEQADALGLKVEPGELKSEDWTAILEDAKAWQSDRRFLVYAWAAYMDQPSPDRIRVQRAPASSRFRHPKRLSRAGPMYSNLSRPRVSRLSSRRHSTTSRCSGTPGGCPTARTCSPRRSTTSWRARHTHSSTDSLPYVRHSPSRITTYSSSLASGWRSSPRPRAGSSHARSRSTSTVAGSSLRPRTRTRSLSRSPGRSRRPSSPTSSCAEWRNSVGTSSGRTSRSPRTSSTSCCSRSGWKSSGAPYRRLPLRG